MRSALAIALAMLTTMPLSGQAPVRLEQLRDRYRPLLLFAPSPDDPALLTQMTRLKDHAAELRDRDVLVIAVPFRDPATTGPSLSAADAEQARRSFHVAPDQFTAILVGKDGGEKYRSGKPVSFEKLQSTIDSMPMRQREMKGASNR